MLVFKNKISKKFKYHDIKKKDFWGNFRLKNEHKLKWYKGLTIPHLKKVHGKLGQDNVIFKIMI